MSSLAIEELRGEYAFYEEPDRWAPKLQERGVSSWILGQLISNNHSAGRFRAEVAEKTTVAGSAVRLNSKA